MSDPADGWAALGAVLAMLSGVAFYIASPNRKVWVDRRLEGVAAASGLLFSAASIVLLQFAMSAPAAVFSWMTIAMLALSAVPFVGALFERQHT